MICFRYFNVRHFRCLEDVSRLRPVQFLHTLSIDTRARYACAIRVRDTRARENMFLRNANIRYTNSSILFLSNIVRSANGKCIYYSRGDEAHVHAATAVTPGGKCRTQTPSFLFKTMSLCECKQQTLILFATF